MLAGRGAGRIWRHRQLIAQPHFPAAVSTPDMADSSPVLVGCSECEPGAVVPSDAPMRRISRWLPIFTAWVDDSRSLSVLAIEDVDPGRLQCKVYAHDGPGGIVKAHQLRFMNPETLESWLQRAQRCAPADRHHRCTCCLEWIYRHARATGAARPRAPSRSRMVIIQPCLPASGLVCNCRQTRPCQKLI